MIEKMNFKYKQDNIIIEIIKQKNKNNGKIILFIIKLNLNL
jgi:hypothetical protein